MKWQSPEILDINNPKEKARLEELLNQGVDKVDNITHALNELFDIRFPSKKDGKSETEVADFVQKECEGNVQNWGNWVFYPWLNKVVHFPGKEDYQLLRTARNQNLITKEEQTTLLSSTIVIAGLSVGSNAVESMLWEGIGGKYILVDMDIIEPTNLNRIRSSYLEVGTHKTDAIAKKISELDPYIEQVHYYDGLDETVLAEIYKKHTVDVFIDEIDTLKTKVNIREFAKQNKTPVIMAADNGENSLLEVERYDKDTGIAIFNGRLPDDVITKVMHDDIPRAELGVVIGEYFVGFENISPRMYQSLAEVGKSLPSWPQLSGAAGLSGVVLAYAAKNILLGGEIKSAQHSIDIEKILNPEVSSREYIGEVQSWIQKLH